MKSVLNIKTLRKHDASLTTRINRNGYIQIIGLRGILNRLCKDLKHIVTNVFIHSLLCEKDYRSLLIRFSNKKVFKVCDYK